MSIKITINIKIGQRKNFERKAREINLISITSLEISDSARPIIIIPKILYAPRNNKTVSK